MTAGPINELFRMTIDSLYGPKLTGPPIEGPVGMQLIVKVLSLRFACRVGTPVRPCVRTHGLSISREAPALKARILGANGRTPCRRPFGP